MTTKVALRLGAADGALETSGAIYREDADLPVARGVSLTGWQAWQGELGSGRHRYVFEVVAGDGPFSLWLEEQGASRQLADYDTRGARRLHVHRFTVIGAGLAVLAEERLRRMVRAATGWATARAPGGPRDAGPAAGAEGPGGSIVKECCGGRER
jgi:hypothetical protein